MTDDEIELAIRNIESLGLRVKMGANIGLRRGNFSGTPYQQAQDLHAMFSDREVKAVWSGRGGSGASLLLPLLDYRLIRANAKVFVGFSDTTALHLAILRNSGVVTFHGPAGISTFSEFSKTYLRAAFMEPRASYVIEGGERTIRPGTAEGRLLGGNLSVLSALVGTPYGARFDGAIAFFEDINEQPYKINRMMTQLAQSGLKRAAGVLWGTCRKCVVDDGEPTLTLEETLDDTIQPLGIPAASGFSFGHVTQHFTIPMGIRARLDATERTLTILEPAVT